MGHLRELYRAAQLPVFQNRAFSTTQDAISCAKGDLILVQDLRTGLIFNSGFQPQLMQYDVDYQNEQAVSPAFRSHLRDVSSIIARHFRDSTLIEIGCGKGYFLEHLQSLGFAVVGLDPTYEGNNPAIHKGYYCPEQGLRADGLILRHVLEHVQHPLDFLLAIRESNGGGGKVYIEVPCLDWICQHRAWFDIYYEHVNYFRIGDFSRLFGRVYETGRSFEGQYLYVVADLESLREPRFDESLAFTLPIDFLDSVDRYSRRIVTQRIANRPSALWGGASKGVLFALFMQRAAASIDYVIDISPAKQGRYLPSTGLRVHSPGDVLNELSIGSDVFVMNANYLSEISSLTNGKVNLIVVTGCAFE